MFSTVFLPFYNAFQTDYLAVRNLLAKNMLCKAFFNAHLFGINKKRLHCNRHTRALLSAFGCTAITLQERYNRRLITVLLYIVTKLLVKTPHSVSAFHVPAVGNHDRASGRPSI